MRNTRNFCIIAHIDHGKSTLADRLLERTGAIAEREMVDQILDDNPLERERGITIKMHAIKLDYKADSGEEYVLNLIDTPGHVDFTYEVSRSLNACEGALLVVDASQGIEAQTISNFYLALEANLEIIPVINKVDLPNAQINVVKAQIMELTGCSESDIITASAKENIGIDNLLNAIVERIPAPSGSTKNTTRALIFDSVFDSYRGAIVYVRVFDGVLQESDEMILMNKEKRFVAEEIGTLRRKNIRTGKLQAGDVGYLIPGIKDVRETKVGDTITTVKNKANEPLPGYKIVKPMVFSGVYPGNMEDFEGLRDALEKLQMNDAAIHFEPETSTALGFGFRCGFLGLLHMEIAQERLDREYDQTIITTVPNVAYKVVLNSGTVVIVDNPASMPSPGESERIEEPMIKAEIITPAEYIGNLMQLCMERRGIYKNTTYLDENRVNLQFEIPLSEIIFDFYDKLKSATRGYASFDYDILDYRPASLVKLDILLNGESIDAFSTIVHKNKAYSWGRKLCSKLKQLIPRQQFEVVIQAAIGSKIISRESIRPVRKNVTAKCYGGDITRKRKLLEKQKEGKKRMKQIGSVEIPQEAFLAVLSMDEQ